MPAITYPGIRGQLRVMVSKAPEERGRVYVEGDPEGLRSLAALLVRLADLDQQSLGSLPDAGASEHLHLLRKDWLSPQSAQELVIGRLDDKQGHFDEAFKPRTEPPKGDITHTWQIG